MSIDVTDRNKITYSAYNMYNFRYIIELILAKMV